MGENEIKMQHRVCFTTTTITTRMNAYPTRPGQTAGTADGSRTITIHEVPTGQESRRRRLDDEEEDGEESCSTEAGVLRLRGGGNTRRVVWTEETIDNEGMGKKKSKSECRLVHL